jgi:hypothetical protein
MRAPWLYQATFGLQAESLPLDSAGFRLAPAGTFTQLCPAVTAQPVALGERVLRAAGWLRPLRPYLRSSARANGALADRP